jgi:hypothetical protein
MDNLNLPWMEHIYRLAEQRDIVVFTNNFGPVDVSSPLSIVSSINIWSFDGPVIATDTFSGRYLVDCPVPSKRFLYVNHIDWHGFDAEDCLAVYNELDLISEPQHAEAVRSTWGASYIVENWNNEALGRVLGE